MDIGTYLVNRPRSHLTRHERTTLLRCFYKLIICVYTPQENIDNVMRFVENEARNIGQHDVADTINRIIEQVKERLQ